MHGSLGQQSESFAPFGSRLNPKAPVWSVFEVKNVGCTLGRQLLALGSVLFSFDQVKVELFDEIENSLRIAMVLSAGSALDWFFAILLHLIHITLWASKNLIAGMAGANKRVRVSWQLSCY